MFVPGIGMQKKNFGAVARTILCLFHLTLKGNEGLCEVERAGSKIFCPAMLMPTSGSFIFQFR